MSSSIEHFAAWVCVVASNRSALFASQNMQKITQVNQRIVPFDNKQWWKHQNMFQLPRLHVSMNYPFNCTEKNLILVLSALNIVIPGKYDEKR